MTEATATNLVRTGGGKTAHRSTCTFVSGITSTARPWHWAEGRYLTDVARISAGVGVKGCSRCKPFEEAAS